MRSRWRTTSAAVWCFATVATASSRSAFLPGPGSNARAATTRNGRKRHAVIPPFSRERVVTESLPSRVLEYGVQRFASDWKSYCAIPIIAGFVGWFTNYLAVQMIFYPIKWRGLPIYKVEGEPFGLLGWQGIIPAKTLKMSEAMVNTTVNELLTMEEIIQRLDPDVVSRILLPQSGLIVRPFVDELLADRPKFLSNFVSDYTSDTNRGLIKQRFAEKFLRDLTVDVQENINTICSLRHCVVGKMTSDRSLLGRLFQISGKDELLFLVDSGLYLGFALGLIQLVISLYFENPWTLSLGGLIVGLATNWLALKWIFEPVNPLRIGPFSFQGLFLRRQNEVSADFSEFFAEQVLTSRQLWKSMLTDPTTLPEWEKLIANRFAAYTSEVTLGAVNLKLKSRKLKAASARVCATLFDYLEDLHDYVDQALEINQTLRARMMAMTSVQFERVLHPIFEEDEMVCFAGRFRLFRSNMILRRDKTLILSGGALGFAAGLVQQYLITGSISIPVLSFGGLLKRILLPAASSIAGVFALSVALRPKKQIIKLTERTRQLRRRTQRYLNGSRRKRIPKSSE